jgi:putative peptidoglycan lipid II flippase
MSLIKSVSVVSLMTFISRILGFARDLLAAQLFGVNPAVDAFYFAFKIPNFMRNMFAEGSFSQAFVPVLAEYYSNKPQNLKPFISHMSGAMWLVLFIITIFGVWHSDALINIFSPGLDPYRYNLASLMLKITFPYLMLISMTALYGAILNTQKLFLVPAITPALLNISLILTALFGRQYFEVPVESQAWGILIAGFVQLAVQIIFVYRSKYWILPKLNWHDAGVKQVLKLMIPALFGASVSQISILINTILASFLVTGSITWLYYSERLAYFPLGIFGVALATVTLPHLATTHSQRSENEFANTLHWGIRWNLIIAIPATLALLLITKPLIITLFYYGKFSQYDVSMTEKSVLAYAFGLPAFMLAKILSSACYACQDLKTPVKYSTIAIAINILLSLIFIKPLAHAGLAFATTCSSWLNVILLGNYLIKRGLLLNNWSMSWINFIARLLLCCVLPITFFLIASSYLDLWITGGFLKRFLATSILFFICGVVYVPGLFCTRIINRA